MTAEPDERSPDHTRPTIAFIVLAVAAAAVMTAGVTENRPDTSMAADPPSLRPTPPLPPPTSPPVPASPAVPEFSLADVVTLAAADDEVTRTPAETPRRAQDRGPGTTPVPEPGALSGRSASGGSASGGSASGGSASGGSGSGDAASGGSGGVDDGPGRSGTGQGKARGQQDTTPGRGLRFGGRRR